ncbi:MAG: DUF2341 domain-containing protein, partial [Candidatus Thermoplasmatota archaeon]|nr:DUF2341 domain-containing protein [Candidatus Thermoplasmatota archaeon]
MRKIHSIVVVMMLLALSLTLLTFTSVRHTFEPAYLADVSIGDDILTNDFSTATKFYRSIIIDSDFIDADLVNFPILVVINDTIADEIGGYESLRFFDQENTSLLSFEIERWGDNSDRIVWVKIPRIYNSDDTVFNMYYGDYNESVENGTGVWDSHYLGVWHCNDSSGNLIDSTKYNNDLLPQGI